MGVTSLQVVTVHVFKTLKHLLQYFMLVSIFLHTETYGMVLSAHHRQRPSKTANLQVIL